jgi:hypothetical protein
VESIVINQDRVSTQPISKKMVERGRCEVCGKPIMVAAWVDKILDRLEREVKACSRAHANVLAGVEELDEAEGE